MIAPALPLDSALEPYSLDADVCQLALTAIDHKASTIAEVAELLAGSNGDAEAFAASMIGATLSLEETNPAGFAAVRSIAFRILDRP